MNKKTIHLNKMEAGWVENRVNYRLKVCTKGEIQNEPLRRGNCLD